MVSRLLSLELSPWLPEIISREKIIELERRSELLEKLDSRLLVWVEVSSLTEDSTATLDSEIEVTTSLPEKATTDEIPLKDSETSEEDEETSEDSE